MIQLFAAYPEAEAESEAESGAESEAEAGAESEAESEAEAGAEAESETSAVAKKSSSFVGYTPRGDFNPMDCNDMVIGMARGDTSRVFDYYTRDR